MPAARPRRRPRDPPAPVHQKRFWSRFNRVFKDRTMSQAWKDYRTALRDLPQEHEESNDAADHWPEAPA